jgi:hypothetical protein
MAHMARGPQKFLHVWVVVKGRSIDFDTLSVNPSFLKDAAITNAPITMNKMNNKIRFTRLVIYYGAKKA